MKAPEDRSYFFDAGLRFECTQCGKCCTGEPGKVWLTAKEARSISALLKISIQEFRSNYCRPDNARYLLQEKENGDCIFFKDGCSIYASRPAQCRTYPFWFENVRSEKAWLETAKACPGVGQGRLYSKEEILNLLNPEALGACGESTMISAVQIAPQIKARLRGRY